MSENEITALRLRIEGFVQAVGYRNFAITEAQRLGINGWIRNRADGTVEALASGERKAVEAFIAACMKGPPGARVKSVDLLDSEPATEKGFRRRSSL